jgi:mannosyltransferase
MITAAGARVRAAIDTTSYARVAHYVMLGVILIAGGFLRLTGLNRQSLWFDEADVVVRAQQPLLEVLRTFVAPGENGPIYNLMLALWIRIADISEIAVRFPSAVFGVLALPLIYLLARRVGGPVTALVATGLLAINPYHVWYSQEAKMYTMVVVLALGSTYALVRALESNRGWWWVGYVAVTTLMFYTHVATVLVFGAQFLYVLFTITRRRDRLRYWLISVAVLTVPYVPIGIWALRVIGGGADTWHPVVTLPEALEVFAVKFAIDRYDDEIRGPAAILYAVLATLGIVVISNWNRKARWWLLLALLVVVPTLGLWFVSLQQSVFSDRYGIVALPAYLILVAAPVVWSIRHRVLWPAGVLLIFLLLAFAWAPLRDVNRTQAAEKEDWRSAYAWVADRYEPGDGIVVAAGYLFTTYEYHAQRDPRIAEIPAVGIGSFQIDWYAEWDMMQTLYDRIEGVDRIWLVQSPERVEMDDPDKRLETWLRENGEELDELRVTGVHVVLYDLDETLVRE